MEVAKEVVVTVVAEEVVVAVESPPSSGTTTPLATPLTTGCNIPTKVVELDENVVGTLVSVIAMAGSDDIVADTV